jgi:hypothetical protein
MYENGKQIIVAQQTGQANLSMFFPSISTRAHTSLIQYGSPTRTTPTSPSFVLLLKDPDRTNHMRLPPSPAHSLLIITDLACNWPSSAHHLPRSSEGGGRRAASSCSGRCRGGLTVAGARADGRCGRASAGVCGVGQEEAQGHGLFFSSPTCRRFQEMPSTPFMPRQRQNGPR